MLKRETSNAWHKSFEKKGVPKKAKIGDGDSSRPAEPESVAGPEVEAEAAGAPYGNMPTFSSLNAARSWFITDWIEKSDMPKSNARREAAVRAWMESQLRADFIAGRMGSQK